MKLSAKVVRNSSGTLCFEVRYKDRPYKVKLYKFQEQTPDGTMIDCTVTPQANGDYFLRQNLPELLRQFYDEGEEYEFEVKHDFTHNGYYELLDARGIPFRLPVPKGIKLLTGSTVVCQLDRIDNSGGQLRLIEADGLNSNFIESALEKSASKKNVPKQGSRELDADAIASRVETEVFGDALPEWDIEQLFTLLFINDDFYDRTVNSSLLEIIRGWHTDGLDWKDIDERLYEMRRAVMYVLEGSNILLTEYPLRRKTLQHRLTVLANHVSGYRKAAEYLSSGRHEEKVNRALNSLRTSGYIYEAQKQLDMLMRIFTLSTDYMRDKMSDIFSIIHARSEDFWRDEPFRKAFIGLLQLYVEECTRGIENSGMGNETLVRSLIEALSIQLLLANREVDSDLFDYNLNLAMLYRYASVMRTSVPANGVRNAFLSLMDVTRNPSSVYQWGDTVGHDLVASKLTVSPVGLEGPFEKWYTCRQVGLSIDNDGVTITRNDVAEQDLKTLELDGVGVWPNLRIRTSQRIASINGTTDIKRANMMWNAVEHALFSDDEDVRRPLTMRKTLPAKDDECLVRVISDLGDGLFRVEVTDDNYEGRGILAMEDIVKYRVPNAGIQHFCDSNGNPYILAAKVKKVVGNVIHFTMLDFIVEYTHEEVMNDLEMTCVVKSSNQYGIVGISERGDAVRFKKTPQFDNIKCGDIIRANWWQQPQNSAAPYIDGVVTAVIENPSPFSTEKAFARLIADYSGGEVYMAPVAETSATHDTAAGEDLLSDARMREYMSIIERKAASESDYMKAYNHLGFVRLLAKMARDDHRREFYEAWMRLISILHYFAVNGEIDPEQLKEFEEDDRSRFDPRSELYRRYLQLKTVSYKGHLQAREELWRLMANEDEEIRMLAENVMAYNLIAEDASMSALGEISDRINNVLKVEGRTSTLHSFGSENKTTEFKTSLIYPPNNHMRANPEAQTLEIMKELCALLNADGGKLFIGVNDFGLGVGVENDLAYKDFGGSEDKYDLYFRHAVCRILGRDVDAYIDSKFDTYGGKRIYVVSALPYFTAPVKVEGIIYERHGSSKLSFNNQEDIERFIERRTEARERERARDAVYRKNIQSTQQETSKSEKKYSVPNNGTEATNFVQRSEIQEEMPAPTVAEKRDLPLVEEKLGTVAEPIHEKIATRTGRRECPANYDSAHDPSTERYLQILEDGFQMISDFYGYNDEEDVLLTLPIRGEDNRGWLVMGYADGTVCRLPIKVLLDKEDYTVGKRFTGAELTFADIIKEDEALLTISEGRRGGLNARADNPDGIAEVASIRLGGNKLFNTDQVSYRFDIIPTLRKLAYHDLFDRSAKDAGRVFGINRSDRLYRQFVNDGYMKDE